jgi:anti-sigma regulatory factor (Ser/Thr protein kinase)
MALAEIPDHDVASWELAVEPRSVPWARAQIRERLGGWGLAELVETMELLVSELVTNALVHGAGTIWLRLIRGPMLLCEVGDDGPELPYVCDAADTDESGRGLQLVSCLATAWGSYRTATGKVVWFEYPA